jgi:tryptophan-rich sensory protein
MDFLKKNWQTLMPFLTICLAIELIGAWATHQSLKTWYQTLIKVSWNPPAWVFAPVWTFLYILIAVAGWLIWEAPYSKKRTVSLVLYGVQLILNVAWPLLFFWSKNPSLALIDLVFLWVVIVLTLLYFWRVNRLAACLMFPYLLWTTFAITLNTGILGLNPGI